MNDETSLLAIVFLLFICLIFCTRRISKLKSKNEELDYKIISLKIADTALRTQHQEALSTAKKSSAPTTDARQLLHDLTRGEAIVRITPINPEDIFIRSPR